MFELNPDAQSWPSNLIKSRGFATDKIYLGVSPFLILGWTTTLGIPFFQRHVVILNSDTNQVGIAKTSSTDQIINNILT